MTHTLVEHLQAGAIRLAKAGIESARLDAELLMARTLECSRLFVMSHPEHELADVQLSAFREMIDRREERRPLAYLTGVKEFHGIEMDVAEGVLVPRPETETLVDECVQRLRERGPSLIADVGTGSGAIAVAVATALPQARVVATEIPEAALEVAARNIAKHQLAERVTLAAGDLLAPLEKMGARFDAILSNPPYIPSGDIAGLEPEIALYEPIEALDGGKDGLDFYRRLLPGVLPLLADGGFTAVEVGAGQASEVTKMARKAGFGKTKIVSDLAGIDRVVAAQR